MTKPKYEKVPQHTHPNDIQPIDLNLAYIVNKMSHVPSRRFTTILSTWDNFYTSICWLWSSQTDTKQVDTLMKMQAMWMKLLSQFSLDITVTYTYTDDIIEYQHRVQWKANVKLKKTSNRFRQKCCDSNGWTSSRNASACNCVKSCHFILTTLSSES